jgi:hypothetical protein
MEFLGPIIQIRSNNPYLMSEITTCIILMAVKLMC